MNTEMVLKVAEYIEQHPGEFDMVEWWGVSEYGTTMCIGATACMLAGLQRVTATHVMVDGSSVPIQEAAAGVLGLDSSAAFALFSENWPRGYYSDGWQPTTRLLRDLAEGRTSL